MRIRNSAITHHILHSTTLCCEAAFLTVLRIHIFTYPDPAWNFKIITNFEFKENHRKWPLCYSEIFLIETKCLFKVNKTHPILYFFIDFWRSWIRICLQNTDSKFEFFIRIETWRFEAALAPQVTAVLAETVIFCYFDFWTAAVLFKILIVLNMQ